MVPSGATVATRAEDQADEPQHAAPDDTRPDFGGVDQIHVCALRGAILSAASVGTMRARLLIRSARGGDTIRFMTRWLT
jgi:hypothetical protein